MGMREIYKATPRKGTQVENKSEEARGRKQKGN